MPRSASILQNPTAHAQVAVRPKYPHKLTSRRSVGPLAEPPRAAARTAHASRLRRVRRLLQLSVSVLGGPMRSGFLKAEHLLSLPIAASARGEFTERPITSCDFRRS